MSIVKCTHCHLEFDEKVMIKEPEEKDNFSKESLASPTAIRYFCCNGCQGVYHLLSDDGLDSFYEKVGNNTLDKPLAVGEDSSNFDMESFAQRYIKPTKDGFSRVDLIIEGIHCAACIWLNEKVLDDTDGILEASINFTNNKAKIIWDEDTIKLSEIINKIRSIGYNAYPYDKSENEKKATANKRDYFLRMSIAIFASMNIMMIDVAKYTGFFTGMKAEVLDMIHFAEFLFATPVLFYSGWIFYRGAYFGLKNKLLNMDFLVASGATLTYIYSLFVLFGGAGHSYFDSVAMIITFVLVGKYLEVLGKKGAVDAMDSIKANIPLEATIIVDGGKKVVSLDEINIGDIIEVKNGEQASVDGEVMTGKTTFDESSLTGESKPILKEIGCKIYSGTINTDQVIRYTALKNYANSTLNNIVELLEDSLSSKPKIEDTTNDLSKYFSIVILAIAIASFSGWYFYNGEFEKSLIIAISVIVIACPCALALATPIASLIGVSWLAREGLLFKEAKFIEVFANATTVVLDKTGTITNGKLKVINQELNLKDEELNLLYSLVDSSTHPVSVSVKKYLEKNYNPIHLDLENIEQLPAVGLKAKYQDKIIFGGRLDSDVDCENTVYNFMIDDKTITVLELVDTIRDDAKQTINYLKSQGLKVIMCSGDNKKIVEKIALEVGIEEYKYRMSPIDKANFINELKENGNIVVMAGDGINDALALSRADISIAMGNGADVAIAISDVVILNDNLSGLEKSIYISKRTFNFIKQNLAISLIYNIITVPIAVMGYVIPLVAALSMSLSSLLVVGNSARIRNRKFRGDRK